MPNRPIVLIHGYSDRGPSFRKWRDALSTKFGDDVHEMPIANYKTLTNEVTIKDIAEGFDRALKLQPGLDDEQEFDAIVHSTGMLVIRSWLTIYAHRRDRLKHLIGLAPATFGSPLARMGRSWFGAVFVGRKAEPPDFFESGDKVLDALELGSRFTWDLAHEDLLQHTYGADGTTPYVFVFAGNKDKGPIVTKLGTGPGTDGTVRWAGMGLVTRKITIDMTKDPALKPEERFSFSEWTNTGSIPVTFIDGLDHTDLLASPKPELIDMVHRALKVSSAKELDAYLASRQVKQQEAFIPDKKWQQFIFHAVDERGDGIVDYNIQLQSQATSGLKWLHDFETDVSPYSADKSYRCFHVDISKIEQKLDDTDLVLTIRASSGSGLVTYVGLSTDNALDSSVDDHGNFVGRINISRALAGKHSFFAPFRTTLVELRLNREPLPLDAGVPNRVCSFLAN